MPKKTKTSAKEVVKNEVEEVKVEEPAKVEEVATPKVATPKVVAPEVVKKKPADVKEEAKAFSEVSAKKAEVIFNLAQEGITKVRSSTQSRADAVKILGEILKVIG